MSDEVPTRVVDMTLGFMNGLAEIQQFTARYNPLKARRLTTAIMDFAYNTVGAFPLAHPRHLHPEHPTVDYRRAIFRRDYILVYRVTLDEVTFLLVYSALGAPKELDLPAED